MNALRTGAYLIASALLGLCSPSLRAAPAAKEGIIDFNRDIRPILSNHCAACHGPDTRTRKAGLRLDIKESAHAKLKSGATAIVPGNLDKSELWQRLVSDDPTVKMPPSKGKPLSQEQIDLVRRWIEQGAPWQEHWAWQTPRWPDRPVVRNKDWVRNGVDAFILARLEKEGLTPAPEADKATLIRRLSLDLIGLPPSPAEVRAFVEDDRSDAYERLVDRLLNSPHFGERWAQHWLDLARYADTNGYHIDNHREMWKWREWVIGAFNRNMPFDQFTVEQLAGDLLPGATLEQKIASGFNRNGMVNFEGGADPNEYLSKYIVDRVVTTSTVWLGATLACAECHDHKYDPFTQKEFYQFYAFFHNVPERGLDGQKENPVPSIKVPTDRYRRRQAELEARRGQLRVRLEKALAEVKDEDLVAKVEKKPAEPKEFVWLDDDLPAGAQPLGNEGSASWNWVTAPKPVHSGKRAHARTAKELSQHLFTGVKEPLKIGEGDKFFAHVYIDPKNPPKEIMLQFHDGSWEHRAYWGASVIPWGDEGKPSRRAQGKLPAAGQWVRLEVDAQSVGFKAGSRVDGIAFTQHGGTVYWDKAGVVTKTGGPSLFASQGEWEKWAHQGKDSRLPAELKSALGVEAGKRTAEQRQKLRSWFLRHGCTTTAKRFEPFNREEETLEKEAVAVEAEQTAVMVMQEMPKPRDTFVLVRGDFQLKGEKVTAGVPAVLPPLPKGMKADRLALARWLVLPEHPLTARVTVNRYWEQLFGAGLVRTGEDFGSQGEWPTHPELLDELALQFSGNGWNVKGLLKTLVMSAAYRQSSRVVPEVLARDPENRLLARAPRYRLTAEAIRDNALTISGLLNRKLGGPSVRPYQPAGLWEQLAFGGGFSSQSYEQSKGQDLYRRGLYTYWKRSLPHPSLVTFDAPNREVCTDRRPRTNTPLQALVLLNDPIFVECARVLGQRVMREGGSTVEERMKYAFQLCTARPPKPEELKILLGLYERQLERFRNNQEAARKLVRVGESPLPSKAGAEMDVSELAAWTAIGNVLLNLDETVTRG